MAKILVSTEELAAHHGDRDWVVFDTRHDLMDARKGPDAYAAGHVPGAYFLSLDHDLSGTKTGSNGRHPLPDPQSFAKLIAARGVGPRTQVVVYDDAGGTYAVRLWWMLRWLGHGAAAVLDGGYPRWIAEGRPISTQVPPLRAGSFEAKPLPEARVDVGYVDRHRGDPRVKLIDARAAERFAGLVEPIDAVAGHIPGAVNRFWKENLQSDGRFKPADALRAEFNAFLEGVDPALVVHSCGSGVTACHNLFAMALAGLPSGRLYPGSWSEWCSDPARPTAPPRAA